MGAMIVSSHDTYEANSAVPHPGYIYIKVDNLPEGAAVDVLIKKNNGGWYSVASSKLDLIKIAQSGNSSEYVLGYRYLWLLKPDMRIVVKHSNGVIIASGEFNASESIIDIGEREDFSFSLNKTYDYNKSKEIIFDCDSKEFKINYRMATFFMYFLAVFITIGAELLIAVLFKIKRYRLIIVTNFVTQVFLHLLTFILFTYIVPYSLAILFAIELFIWVIEYKVYRKCIKDVDREKIISYVLTANIITFFITFAMPILVQLFYFFRYF